MTASARVATSTFVQLKLTLLRNGARQSTGRSAAFISSFVLAGVVGVAALAGLLALRGHQHIATASIVLVAVLALGWAFMPLFVGSSDETLDPGRLVMLPLRPRPLLLSQLAASVIGIGPVFTLLLASGTAFAPAQGSAGFVTAVLAVPLVLLFCTTLARALAAANAQLLSSRRGRDLAILSGLIAAFGIQGLNLAVTGLLGGGGIGPLETAAGVLRWLPPVAAVDAVRAASEGSYGAAAGGLALTAAGLGLLLWWWLRSLTRLMTSPDSTTLTTTRARRGRGTMAGGRAQPAFLTGRTATVMQRTLRHAWRDPKTKMSWAISVGMGLLMPLVFAAQGSATTYHACWAACMLGLLMYNQFGQDYSAFWLVVQTISGPRDAYLELRARALAITLIGVPYTAIVVVIAAATSNGWAVLPQATGLALALLGATVGTGAVASARFAYTIPQSGVMRNVAAGQSSLVWYSIVAGMLVGGLLCAPVIGLTIWLNSTADGWLWTVLPLGVGWGVLMAYTGLRLAAPQVSGRLPEILHAVSRE